MAVDGRINVRHEDVFPVPVLLLGVEPAEEFEKVKAARAAGQVDEKGRVVADVQTRDKETGLRVWLVSILDPSARQGQREIKVKIAAEHQPVPPNGLMHPCEFDGLQVVPWLDQQRCSGRQEKCRARQGIAYRATGFKGKRQNTAA
jgi:hypothetical protein